VEKGKETAGKEPRWVKGLPILNAYGGGNKISSGGG